LEIKNSTKNQGIQVISRAADILRLLSQETGGLSLAQIAGNVSLPRSTVQRIVSALSDEGLVSNERGHGSIKLGPEIMVLAQASTTSMRSRLYPIMKKISDDTGETVDLAILEGNHMRFIDQIVGSQRLRTVSSIGESFPLTTTANGKAALAQLDKDLALSHIELECKSVKNQNGLKKNSKKIEQEIDNIRGGEIARDMNEHTEGICALGIAVQDEAGDVYAISTPVPSSRFGSVEAKLAESLTKYLKNI